MLERARVSNEKTKMKGVARMKAAIVRRVLLPKSHARMKTVVERAAALWVVDRKDAGHGDSQLLLLMEVLSGGGLCCPLYFEGCEFITGLVV